MSLVIQNKAQQHLLVVVVVVVVGRCGVDSGLMANCVALCLRFNFVYLLAGLIL